MAGSDFNCRFDRAFLPDQSAHSRARLCGDAGRFLTPADRRVIGMIFYAEAIDFWVLFGAALILAANFHLIRVEARAP